MFRLLTLAALLCCWSSVTFTQTPKSDSAEVMRQLLALPAPTPRQAQTPGAAEARPPRPEKFFDKANPPADDAPLEDLMEYWLRWVNTPAGPVLSEVNKQRLLDACSEDIRILIAYVSVFPAEESTAKRIKDLYDKASSDESLKDISLETVKNWLLFNSKYFVDELFARASKVKENDKTGSVDNHEPLVALARLDWQTAEPLVKGLASGSQPRSSALALTLLYRQAIIDKDLDGEEKYRSRLRAIASDRNAPGRARDTSIEALSKTEWSGRDDWYLSLFADDSLRETFDGNYGFSPLTTLFNRDPDKWIPVMTRLVESKDRAVQQAAASCLVIYATNHPRRDAILPVLRWLSDPDWLQLRGGTTRAWFMQVMNKVEIPESVPGLIWIVENDDGHGRWAARTLAHYNDPRAVPVLKKALSKGSEDDRRLILEGLVASGGLPDMEGVAALEAYAVKRMTAEGREDLERYRSYNDEPLPLPVSIGRYLANMNDVPDSLARSVLARAESLKKSNPALAESLLAAANRWQGRAIDLDMVHRIGAGAADVNTISTALERRTKLRESLGAELQMLLERTDEALGIGVVLLNDPQMAQTILASGNHQPQIGLLAGARLTQTPLPMELVGRLLSSKNPLLALAAERYLLAEDSKDARKLLWQHHPDQAFITGWRENYGFLNGGNFEPLVKAEEKLRAELFKEEGPIEIFALIGNSEHRYSYIVRVYANKATYTHYEDNSRYRERVISQAELAAFKQFVVTAGFADLGPQFADCHHNCWVAEFLALKKSEAWRVLSHGPFVVWEGLLAKFDLLGRGEGARIRYDLENEIKGLEVLYADDKLLVKDVWQGNDEIRIFVERPETEEEFNQRQSSEVGEQDPEAARAERRRNDLALEKARFSWRKLDGNKAAVVVA
ncbi:MAG TPA: HEAT repeat domain-containing protein, partial [Pyrinomonadaceae bacterium]|nr:HEAT repeat domain-containing protein [Pyrinomonadaceae bacterium]